MYKIQRYRNKEAYTISKIAGAIGKGIIAGAAGTAAITLSQIIEMKITKRKPSDEPAEAAEKVLDVKPKTEEDKSKLSQEMHWAYGTTWGIPRAVISLLGLKGLPASAIHFAAIYTGALTVPASLKIAPPLKEWSAKEILIDALHHAVYALTAGLVLDAMSSE